VKGTAFLYGRPIKDSFRMLKGILCLSVMIALFHLFSSARVEGQPVVPQGQSVTEAPPPAVPFAFADFSFADFSWITRQRGSEVFRHGEVQLTQLGIGGDFLS